LLPLPPPPLLPPPLPPLLPLPPPPPLPLPPPPHPPCKFIVVIFFILAVAAIAMIVEVLPVAVIDDNAMPGPHCHLCCQLLPSLLSCCFCHHHCCQYLRGPADAASPVNMASFSCGAVMVMNYCRDSQAYFRKYFIEQVNYFRQFLSAYLHICVSTNFKGNKKKKKGNYGNTPS
jgi:hypothetical protein